eukprot:403375570
MVFRPHILRYKGKLRKLDNEKVQKLKSQQDTAMKDIQSKQYGGKMNFAVYLAGATALLGPFLYIKHLTSQSVDHQKKINRQFRDQEEQDAHLLLDYNYENTDNLTQSNRTL